MSYDPKTVTNLANPSDRLRRDITLLSDEQKTKIFDEAIGDLPDADKPGLVAMLPKPIDDANDKIIEDVDEREKAKNADYVVMHLPPEQQKKMSDKVAEMLKEAQHAVEKKKPAAEEEDFHTKPKAATHHKEHAHAR